MEEANQAADEASTETQTTDQQLQNVQPYNPATFHFSLSPGMSTNQIINFATREGSRIYETATKQIGEERFDCDPGRMRAFIEEFSIRAINFGWHTVFEIPNDLNELEPVQHTTNLLSNYGDISLEHIQEHARTYVTAHSRAAQDSYMAFNCLLSSLSATAIDRITIWRDQYMINGVPSAACLFKIIIRETYIDTNATVTHIRTQLSSLDQYLPTIQHNITKMNQHVKQLLEGLAARGETTSDLLANLFKGYKAASDRNFVTYIMKKEEDYHEGVNMTPDHLMTLADNKYKTLLQLNQWNAPSPEEEKILALEAKLQQLTSKRNNKLPNDRKGNSKRREPRNNERPEWMANPPKENEPKEKTVEGETYYWCPTHKFWGKHKPVDCRLASGKKHPTKSPPSRNKLIKALAALMTDGDSDEDENTSESDDDGTSDVNNE